MITVSDVNQFMLEFAPLALAEEWDNVGLLVGDPDSAINRVMTCLTITPESAAEAVAKQADLIVTHHPLPFRPLKRITTEQTAGRLLLQLIKAGIAVISPHTAFDSALNGINAQLAERFQLSHARPLMPAENSSELGAGRMAEATPGTTLQNLLEQAKSEFALPQIRFVGSPDSPVKLIGLGCGSGGAFLQAALQNKCDTLITGEAQFHTCLEAKASGVSLILLGHHTSERFALRELAGRLDQHFTELDVWVSEDEEDPIRVG